MALDFDGDPAHTYLARGTDWRPRLRVQAVTAPGLYRLLWTAGRRCNCATSTASPGFGDKLSRRSTRRRRSH